MENTSNKTEIRSQIEFPLDAQSERILIAFLEKNFSSIIARYRKDALTILAGATVFDATSNYMVLTGAAGVTIGTIRGGYEGQVLILEFTDANVTITDTATGAADTVNLSAAFTSTANDTLCLIYNGTSWRELSRAIN